MPSIACGCSDCAIDRLSVFFLLSVPLHIKLQPVTQPHLSIFFSGLTDIRFLFVSCLNIRPIRHIRSPGIVVKCNSIFMFDTFNFYPSC